MNARLSQLLTLVLAGVCGFFLLLIILFQFGVGRGYRWWPLDDTSTLSGQGRDLDHSSFSLPAWDSYADVNKRPLFNEDRRPTPPPPPEAAISTAAPIPHLNVVLSGVIISKKVRLALIKENGKPTSTAVKEGGALGGDLAAWSLAQVKPRAAIFKSSAGESVEVELIASAIDQKPTPPSNPPAAVNPAQPQPQPTGAAPPAAPPPGNPATAEAKPAEQPPANADLQQRIEARRQQLREQNDRARQQQGQSQ
jgi:general secretion pathway protein N